MITPELEMRPMARRGMTAEELELKRYAASELRGHPRCLLLAVARRIEREHRRSETADEVEREESVSGAPANAWDTKRKERVERC